MKRAPRYGTRLFLGLWLVFAILLGVSGLHEHLPHLSRDDAWSDMFVRLWQLFTFGGLQAPPAGPPEMNWRLQVARVVAPLFSLALGAEVFRRLFAERCIRWRLKFARGHAIVCGLGERGRRLAVDLRGRERAHGRGRKYLVAGLESSENADAILTASEGGVLVLTGDATEEYLLQRANLSRAALVVALCGTDRTNVEIAMTAHEIWQRDMVDEPTWQRRAMETLGLEPPSRAVHPGRELDCHVHIANRRMRDLLQYSELGRQNDGFNLRFFNLHDLIARQFLADELPLPKASEKLRLLLVGFGALGEALLVRYVQLAHFGDGTKPHIVVVTRDARRWEDDFLTCWPAFREVPELAALKFLEMDPVNYAAAVAVLPGERSLMVVAHDDEGQALRSAFELHEATRGRAGIVHVRIGEGRGMARLLQSRMEHEAHIKPFGALAEVCRAEVLLESPHDRRARAVHAGYLAHLQATDKNAGNLPRPCGSTAHPDHATCVEWAFLPEDLRDANRRSADHLEVKLKQLGLTEAEVAAPGFAFTPAQEALLCRMEHHRWCADRWLNGWRKGIVTDRSAKLHAGLVPWEDLPDPEKEKDLNQIRGIPGLLRGT